MKIKLNLGTNEIANREAEKHIIPLTSEIWATVEMALESGYSEKRLFVGQDAKGNSVYVGIDRDC